MLTFVIERDIPAALQDSCVIFQNPGPRIDWIESFVTADKVYCVYAAPSEEIIREYAREAGFPEDKIRFVSSVTTQPAAER